MAFASAPEMYSDTLEAANAQRLFVCVVALCPGLRGACVALPTRTATA